MVVGIFFNLNHFEIIKNVFNCIYLFKGVGSVLRGTCGSQGTVSEVGSLLPPCKSWRSNSTGSAASASPAEPSPRPEITLYFYSGTIQRVLHLVSLMVTSYLTMVHDQL